MLSLASLMRGVFSASSIFVALLCGIFLLSLLCWLAGDFVNSANGVVAGPPLDVVCPSTHHVFPAYVEGDAEYWMCSKCLSFHKTSDTRFSVDGVIQEHLLTPSP